jgi:hypothetical protein
MCHRFEMKWKAQAAGEPTHCRPAVASTRVTGADGHDGRLLLRLHPGPEHHATEHLTHPSARWQAMEQHLRARPELLPAVLTSLFELVLFEDVGNQWSLSRPMLALILVNEDIYLELQRQIIAAQPADRCGVSGTGGQVDSEAHGQRFALVSCLRLTLTIVAPLMAAARDASSL